MHNTLELTMERLKMDKDQIAAEITECNIKMTEFELDQWIK
jgi:hypothetical protein